MKIKFLFIIAAIIINSNYVTLNKPRDNIFGQLLNFWMTEGEVKVKNDEKVHNESQCQIDVKRKLNDAQRRQSPQPLYIHSGTSKFFHPKDQSGVIRMRKNDKIELFCTDGFAPSSSHLTDIIRDRNLVTLTCSGNNGFKIDADDYDDYDENIEDLSLTDFMCRKHPRHTALRSQISCFNNSSLINIGFQVDNKRFMQVLTVCHDSKRYQTYYAKYQLSPANAEAHQRAIKRPSFIQSDFYPGKDINLLYSRRHQRDIISKFSMGAELLSDDVDPSMFLSRGHLAAKGDFIYGNEQRATFYYLNVMPQWQTFNSLNWLAVEDGSRRLAADRNITLTVYTGTHGVAKLRNANGRLEEFYLDMVNKQIPVPKLFYKILINAKTNSGIALICVNNVHITIEEIHRDYVICEDISDDIKYIKWRKTEIRRGFCYACDVGEFLAEVPHLKDIKVKNLLI